MIDGAFGTLPRSRRLLASPILICGVVMATAACGSSSSTSSSSPSIPKVTITASGTGFSIQPTTPVPAGLIEFDLRNDDGAPHEFKFASPLAGATLDQIKATVSSATADQLFTQLGKQVELGFSWGLPPHSAQTLYLTYQASTDFVLSLISTGPSVPAQAANGYLAQFTVRGTQPAGLPQPQVAGAMTITSTSLTVPSGFGKGTFAIVNSDAAAGHRLTFYRFTGGAKPLADVVAAFAAAAAQQGFNVPPGSTPPPPPTGPPPEITLGMQRLGGPDPFPPYGCSCIMGSQVLGTFALSPGTYVVLGDGYDFKTNKLEASEGIAAEFTVS
jgi:hypothetical protein